MNIYRYIQTNHIKGYLRFASLFFMFMLNTQFVLASNACPTSTCELQYCSCWNNGNWIEPHQIGTYMTGNDGIYYLGEYSDLASIFDIDKFRGVNNCRVNVPGVVLTSIWRISVVPLLCNDYPPIKTNGPSCSVASGVSPATGNTYYTDSDTTNPLGFDFTKHKNNHGGDFNFGLGVGWTSNSLQRIDVFDEQVILRRATGRSEMASCSNIGACNLDPDSKLTLEKTSNGYELITSDNSLELYDSQGRLSSITNTTGYTLNMSYHPGTHVLSFVGDSYNRFVNFYHDANDNLRTIIDLQGNSYTYAYDSNNNLISVTYPDDTPEDENDNPVKQYLYEDNAFPNHLTGVINENGIRTHTWGYDTQGRVIYTETSNGTSRVDLIYNPDGTTTVTDALGTTNTFSFVESHEVKHVSGISGGQCASGCSQGQAQSYDANGFLSSRTDFQGNVTTYINNIRGLETSRTEASGTPQARTITTEWHPTFRLPIKITESGKETTFTYDTDGNLLSRSEK